MNVWIVNPFDNLPQEGLRPQRYWLMARAFTRAGHHVTLWTSDFSHATKAKRRWHDDAKCSEGIDVIQIPTHPYPTNVCLARIRSHRQLARDFARMAEATAPKPDIIIASTPPLGLCAAAMKFAKAHDARFVCDIQDAWPETFLRLLPSRLRRFGRLLFAPMFATARKIYHDADLVTGVCRRYAELSGRTDFHLAYHGIESDGTTPPSPHDQKAMLQGRLVYAGNLGVGYDLKTVLRAVKMNPTLTLDIAGKGPREESLKQRVTDWGLEGRVRFHGYLGANELRGLLAHCDTGVIPMRDDSWVGLPYKLGDYLTAGLHVISSLHGECGALLERTGFGHTYEWGRPDTLLAAYAVLPNMAVSLPPELSADSIYPQYVQKCLNGLRHPPHQTTL